MERMTEISNMDLAAFNRQYKKNMTILSLRRAKGTNFTLKRHSLKMRGRKRRRRKC